MKTLEHTGHNLAERILDSFPSGTYMLGTLLHMADVVETNQIETAAVECVVQPRLLINPEFVDTWANTPERLLMLVMHELHHVILGHTRLLCRITVVDNLVFDAVINAMLCRMFPDAAHTSLFTRYYSHERFPACLLRPPPRWDPDAETTSIPGALSKPGNRAAAEVYRALYSREGATYEELYEILTASITERQAEAVPLLGDHSFADGSADGELENRSPMMFDIVRKIVEEWPQPPNPLRGRSLNDLMGETKVPPRRRLCNRTLLRNLLRRIGGIASGNGVHRVAGTRPLAVQTPVPSLDRRSIVLRALGAPSLLHADTVAIRKPRREGQRVHVYLDVSGSIDHLKGALYGAVLDCQAFVNKKVHLFSTKVADVSINDLRRGVCRSTGGTDINCVAEHIARHSIRRAVVITDGFVGPPKGIRRTSLEKMKLGVALIPGFVTRDDLAGVTDHWVQMNDTK